MEFHIPHFAMRESLVPEDFPTGRVNNNAPRNRTDLSFLKVPLSEAQTHRTWGLYERQISFVICGSDFKIWTGYAFVDTPFDEDDDLEEKVYPYEGLHEDPIASYGGPSGVIDANFPIWDPREYFLLVIQVRIAQVRGEWEYLVRKVERSIKRYVCYLLCYPSFGWFFYSKVA
jgi:hypothetical protein